MRTIHYGKGYTVEMKKKNRMVGYGNRGKEEKENTFLGRTGFT